MLVESSVPADSCWLWNKCHGRYGFIKRNGKMLLAHRLMYEIFNGPIPMSMFVLHRCDVKLCVNPKHLYLGTHKQNMRDMVDRGRSAFGERCGTSILNEEKVLAIRSLHKNGQSIYKLAKNFKASKTAISLAVKRKTWRHI